MAPKTTMLDLVTALSRSVRTDAEVVADVAFLVNTGRVLLCGSFKGARIIAEGDLSPSFTRPSRVKLPVVAEGDLSPSFTRPSRVKLPPPGLASHRSGSVEAAVECPAAA